MTDFETWLAILCSYEMAELEWIKKKTLCGKIHFTDGSLKVKLWFEITEHPLKPNLIPNLNLLLADSANILFLYNLCI